MHATSERSTRHTGLLLLCLNIAGAARKTLEMAGAASHSHDMAGAASVKDLVRMPYQPELGVFAVLCGVLIKQL